MLKFNLKYLKIVLFYFIYLNTSYVKVQCVGTEARGIVSHI